MPEKFPKRDYSHRGDRPPRTERPRPDDRARRDERPRRDDRPRSDNRGRRDERPRSDERPRNDDRAPRGAPATPVAAPTAWEPQAAWYDQAQGDAGDDFYRTLILPAVLRQLGATTGQRVLDVGCGQGVVGRALAADNIASVGIDASPALIEAARKRGGTLDQHRVGDVRALAKALNGESFDHATLVLCLQDLDPLVPVLTGVAAAVKLGGRCVIVLTHPCFRIPKRSAWGWDDQWGIQYRRVDAYCTPQVLPIKTHPGRPFDASQTSSFHRPLSTYLNALGTAGLGVIACEELCSHRRGTQGVRSSAEDRAAKEIPLFLVLTAVRR